MSSNCSIILNIPLNSGVFGKNNSISEIIINDTNQSVPLGTFNTGEELGNLLASAGWSYTLAFNHIYVLETILNGFNQNSDNQITFSDMTYFNFVTECCSGSGSNGGTQNGGTQNGGSGTSYIEDLLALETPLLDCFYSGVLDADSDTFTFLQNIVGRHYILVAKDSPNGVVKGPFAFNNQSEFLTALQNLNATLVGNLITIHCDMGPINQVYFLNNQMNVIASVSLMTEKCCPEGFDSSSELMARLGGELAWVPVECLPETQRDLNQEVSQLPICQKYKCVLKWDLTEIFLAVANSEGGNAPWKLSQIELLGEDVSAEYSQIDFSSVGELGEALIRLGVGWSQVLNGGSVYSLCFFRDSLPVDMSSNYTVVNNMYSVIYSGQISVECLTLEDQELQLVMKVGNKGTFLGGPSKIFDSVSECSGLSYTCSTVVVSREVYQSLLESCGGSGGVWSFCEIKVGGQEQVVLTTQFSTLAQLEAVLQNMGWEDVGAGVYTLSVTVGVPSSQSYLKVMKVNGVCGDAGGGADSGVFLLNTSCIADCVPENENRLILTRDEFGKYCWQSPSCFKGGDMNIMLNHGLDEIPDCNIDPQFTIEILLKNSLVGLIQDHFSSNGPFWINFYKIEDPFGSGGVGSCGGQAKEDVLKLIPGQVFSLEALVDCLVEGLGWEIVSTVENGNGSLSEARLSLVRRAPLITGICINREGELGEGLPFDFLLPITSITNLFCPGLSNQSQVLIRGPTGYCFVDIDCFMPIIPPPVDVDKAISDLPTCPEDLGLDDNGLEGDGEGFEFCVSLKLDPCDLVRLGNNFGGILNDLFITGYKLVGGTNEPGEVDIAVDPPQSIGNGTFADFVNAFVDLGWSLGVGDDVNNPPVLVKQTLNKQVNYVVINRLDGVDGVAPFPVLLSASSSRIINCPSLDPENKTLIKKPDGSVCWTQICPLGGPVGPAGPTGAGIPGPTGPMGEGPALLLGVTGLAIQVCENLCATGDVHYGIIPDVGGTGFSGNVSISLEPFGNGFLSAQKPTPGSTDGGNCRGIQAVDWQMKRNNPNQVAGGQHSVISGGFGNAIIPFNGDPYSIVNYTVIGGGYQNSIRAENEFNDIGNSFIGGGVYNQISSSGYNTKINSSCIVGGSSNIISTSSEGTYLNFTSIGGGRDNLVISNGTNSQVSAGAIVGGRRNIISTGGDNTDLSYTCIGGGLDNRISSGLGTTGGTLTLSNIGGGGGNQLLIANGINNSIQHSNISGGKYNIIGVSGTQTSSSASSISGGSYNRITVNGILSFTQNSTISGGSGNQIGANGTFSFVSGSTIGGGVSNGIVSGGSTSVVQNAVIAGGNRNFILADGLNSSGYGSILGGANNVIYAGGTGNNINNAVIAGSSNIIFTQGTYNQAYCNGILSGCNNRMFLNGVTGKANFSTILGGSSNTLELIANSSNSARCVSIQGCKNKVRGGTGADRSIFDFSTIGGGYTNTIYADDGATNVNISSAGILSGGANQINSTASDANLFATTIVGGTRNSIDVSQPGGQTKCSIIGGGYRNSIKVDCTSGDICYSAILGGKCNSIVASGTSNNLSYASILSGSYNRIRSFGQVYNSSMKNSSIISGSNHNINIQRLCRYSNITNSSIVAGYENSILSVGSDNQNTDNNNSVILGGHKNFMYIKGLTASSNNCIIGGGYENTIFLDGNYIYGNSSTILGGSSNKLYLNSTTGGNTTTSSDMNNTVIAGGRKNIIGNSNINAVIYQAKLSYSNISGGYQNKIIIQGYNNNSFSSLRYTVIGGGSFNEIRSRGYTNFMDNSAILSGRNNIIANNINTLNSQIDSSVISGGKTNQISINASNSQINFAHIGGGYRNSIVANSSNTSASFSSILGGYSNTITASSTIKYSLIGGGANNSMKTSASTSDVSFSTILGGRSNSIFTYGNFTRSATYNTIVGGFDNKIKAEDNNCNYSIIGGGVSNKIYQSNHSLIAGGYLNHIYGNMGNMATSQGNVISGGIENTITASGSVDSIENNTISGGFKNHINVTKYSIIAGGSENSINKAGLFEADSCGIFGGKSNQITGSVNCVIIGGDTNKILSSDRGNAIIGGKDNTINQAFANDSVILGGVGLQLTDNFGYGFPRVVCGRYNLDTNAPLNTNRVFTIGGGTSNGARFNLFSVNTVGDVRHTGTLMSSATADFAEFFESLEGLAIPIGTTVSVDTPTGKIKPCQPHDVPIGVITGTPSILCNVADEEWAGKYLKDDYGQYLHEIIKGEKRRVVNPDFDPTKEYIPRKDRPEWNVVGLLGQIHITKGQPVAPGWVKIKDMPGRACDLWLVK